MSNDVTMVREWDADGFHQHVARLESEGFVARLETYCIQPEMNPETGEIIHLYTIEMDKRHSDLVDSGTCEAVLPPS